MSDNPEHTQTLPDIVDRTGWPMGPWDNEPDRVEWRDPTTGLPCLLRRHSHFGTWCGYVAVPPGHPWHGRDSLDIDASVHGGVSFAGPCDDDEEGPDRICHVPQPGEPDNVWWFGFDCAHGWDLAPGYLFETLQQGQTYRTLDYARDQCQQLAAQAGPAHGN